MIAYPKFSKALKRLELQLLNLNSSAGRPCLTDLDTEALAESVIHRFETCYDCLWNILKRYLIEELGLPEVPNSPKPILRLASENRLLPSPVEQWLRYAEARVETSHDYSGGKAAECLGLMDRFVADSIALHETLTGETWE